MFNIKLLQTLTFKLFKFELQSYLSLFFDKLLKAHLYKELENNLFLQLNKSLMPTYSILLP